MNPPAPEELLALAATWDELHRWERAELGRAFRRLGWSYGEIREVIPVPKGTLSYWCREIRLSEEQVEAIKERTGSRVGVPVDTQRKRRLEIERIREEARWEADTFVKEPFWTLGIALYWGEGAKTNRQLELANADPHVLTLFMRWTETYLMADAEYTLALNLHANNDELAARFFWAQELGLSLDSFTKSFIKPDGTGHRKNHLPHGVCRVRVRRSTDAWVRVMEWIEVLPELVPC